MPVGYRDDNEALRARVRALEGEVKRLEARLENRATPQRSPPLAASEDVGGGAEIRELVLAREAAEREARDRALVAAERQRARRIARYARRPRRVRIAPGGGGLGVTIAPQFLRDSLREQAVWGLTFSFINPGVFVVIGLTFALSIISGVGLGAAALMAVPLWAVILTLLNVVYARWTHRRYRLELTGDGHFALYTRDRRRPLLLGRSAELEAQIDEPDPASLGSARLSDGHKTVEIKNLTAADLEELRQVLR